MSDKVYKILLVDDDESLRKLYQMEFENYPEFMLFTAESTKKGLDIMEDKKPDLILLDLILGKEVDTPLAKRDKIEGFNFLEYVRMEDAYRDIPIVILSNLDGQMDMDKANKMGAVGYLVKAKTLPSEVVQKVKEFLK